MDIRLSKYNYPFSEPAELNVHYISLDHQLLIKLGIFDAHVQVFRSLPVSRTLEIFDPLSGTTHVHDMNGAGFFRPFNSAPTVVGVHVDLQFVDQLRKSHVKAAVPRMSLCTCGNSRRPWRCVCNK